MQRTPDAADLELVANAEQNTRRYQNLFCEAADDLMRDVSLFPPSSMAVVPKDVFDVMLAQVFSPFFSNTVTTKSLFAGEVSILWCLSDM